MTTASVRSEKRHFLTTASQTPRTAGARWVVGRFAELSMRSKRWASLVIVLVAAAVYLNSLGNYFLVDDFWHLNEAARTPWAALFQPWQYSGEDFKAYWFNEQRLHGVRGEGFFRPMVTLLYKLAGAAFGLDAWGYHLVNVALHALASLAVFAVARLMFSHRWVAVAVALMFAAHPSHAETVQWVAANADAAMGCFFLASFAAFGWWLRQRRPWQYGGAVVAFVAALCSKESAIVLPAVLLAYEFYRAHIANKEWPRFGELAARHAVFWTMAAAYLLMHIKSFAGISAMNEGGQYMHSPFSATFVPFVLFNLSYELLHLAVPFPLFPIDPGELIQRAGVLPVTLVCAAVLAALWFGTSWLMRGLRGWSFFPLFTVLTLAPTFPILVAQRFLYVPSLGFCLLLGALLQRADDTGWLAQRWSRLNLSRRGLVMASVGVVVAGYAMMTMFLNLMWGLPSNLVRRQITAIRQELPSLPRGSSLYLLNLWPPAFGMEFMLPLLYQDPTLDVQVLTIRPKMLPIDSVQPPGAMVKFFSKCLPDHIGATRIESRWNGLETLRVSIEGGRFMRSLTEEVYPAAAEAQRQGARVDTPGFTAEVVRADAGGVQTLAFRFRSTDPPPMVLDMQNGRAERVR
ncbi:MAG: glycosyltransferase family 39 protein [Verrucomicrobia bacterium]|nr:glycosyltransferase family 39 protein [Verrucomicrobiota bacterium]